VPHPEQTQVLAAQAEVGIEGGITAKPTDAAAPAVPNSDPNALPAVVADSLVPPAFREEEQTAAPSVIESPAVRSEDRLYADTSKETKDQAEERNKEELRLQELLAPSEDVGEQTAPPVMVNESAPVAAAAQEEIPGTHNAQHRSDTGAASPAEFTTESLLTGFNTEED
jgi:hypothetical protein